MKQGDKLWNGATVSHCLAMAYNSIQARIQSFRDAGQNVPEYLLNGAHNLIASAPCDESDAIAIMRTLDVLAMQSVAIYAMRETIAELIIRARHDYRELESHTDCRARGNSQRQYVESIADRLAAVLKP